MLAASADGGVLAFGAEQCRDPDEVIGVIRGHAVKTWQTTYPLDFASLSISADGNLLAFSTARLGGGSHQHPQARLLDTSAKPGSAAAASTLLYTYPAGAVVPAVVLAPDAATAYFQWITGGHESMLTGYRIGPDGLSGEQFSDTLPAEQRLAWAGNRLAVWLGPPFSLVDPATGATSLVRAPWTNDYQIAW